MTVRKSPTVRRRLLSTELRRLREASGLTGTEVAKGLGWHSSKLTRAERNEWRLPNLDEVAKLLDFYQVPEPRREQLLGWARDARKRGWWYAYREVSDEYSNYIGLEAATSTLRNYEPLIVPGLLQTAAYARALMAARKQATAARIDALVEVRMERQQQLLTDTTDPVELWAVVGEAVLHHTVGGPQVMGEQLDHLLKMAELPHVNLFVAPFKAGLTMVSGPFVLMTFADNLGPEALYLESPAGPIWIEDEASLAKFRLAWEETLHDSVLTAADTMALIREMAANLPR